MRMPGEIVLIAAGFACLATSCSKSAAGDKPLSSPVAATPAPPTDPFAITPEEPMLRQLKVGEVKTKPLSAVINVAARVEVDGTRITRVGSPVMGRVTKLFVHEGERVEQGQSLALVSSTLLSDGQLAFLKAQGQSQVARRAVERARILLKSEVIGSAEMQRREAELAEAEAEREAARDQLGLLGMAPEAIEDLEKNRKINSTSRIVASMGGTVLSRRVTLGQVVQPADSVFEIADLSSLWLAADVPAPEAGSLFIGQSVEAEILANHGPHVFGKLSFVAATVNEETRTVRVHMPIDNARGLYKPAMLAELRLRGRPSPGPCVPNTAVVREDNREHVFVERPGHNFRLAPVELGDEFGDCRQLLSGLELKQPIVLDGAFHLNNERRRRVLRSSGGE